MPTALERSGQYGQDTLDQGAKLGAPHAGQDRLGEQFGAALIGCRVGRVPRRLGAAMFEVALGGLGGLHP
jgi:hypothetical protein